jgi:hypothetical protein
VETPKIEQKNTPILQIPNQGKIVKIIYFSRCFSNISISKIKLAFGGITPPAPLSPYPSEAGRRDKLCHHS